MRCKITLVAVLIMLAAGCASTPNGPTTNRPPLTAKKVIRKGQTTHAEVVRFFGPPDQVTRRDDIQICTWDKVRHDIRQSSDYLDLIVYSDRGRIAGSVTKTTMLIVYFNADEVVKDYRMIATRF